MTLIAFLLSCMRIAFLIVCSRLYRFHIMAFQTHGLGEPPGCHRVLIGAGKILQAFLHLCLQRWLMTIMAGYIRVLMPMCQQCTVMVAVIHGLHRMADGAERRIIRSVYRCAAGNSREYYQNTKKHIDLFARNLPPIHVPHFIFPHILKIQAAAMLLFCRLSKRLLL